MTELIAECLVTKLNVGLHNLLFRCEMIKQFLMLLFTVKPSKFDEPTASERLSRARRLNQFQSSMMFVDYFFPLYFLNRSAETLKRFN